MIIDGKFYGRIQQKDLYGTWKCPRCTYQMSPQYLRVSDKTGEIKWDNLKPLCRGILLRWCKRGAFTYRVRCNTPMDYIESSILERYTYEDIEAFIEDHKGDLI